jgi:hypothetical protein
LVITPTSNNNARYEHINTMTDRFLPVIKFTLHKISMQFVQFWIFYLAAIFVLWLSYFLQINSLWAFRFATRTDLTLRLLTGYKMYVGTEFSWTFLAGTEKQSYQFFCLFTVVPLTQHNHHSAHILVFTCGRFLF